MVVIDLTLPLYNAAGLHRVIDRETRGQDGLLEEIRERQYAVKSANVLDEKIPYFPPYGNRPSYAEPMELVAQRKGSLAPDCCRV